MKRVPAPRYPERSTRFGLVADAAMKSMVRNYRGNEVAKIAANFGFK
jgi:hypothetical protein